MARAAGGGTLPFLVSDRGIALALALMLAAGLVFALDPGLDLAGAGLFYRDGAFVGAAPAGAALRAAFYYVPAALALAGVALFGLRRLGRRVPAPTARGLAVLLVSFALGPGLLVNAVLKDHWHRPRPVQVEGFGGTLSFRPFDDLGGGCARNCSFVSGEGAASFWTVAPAMMAPAPVSGAALAAALAFAAAAGLLRVAAGGHFPSDAVFAALLTWLVIAAAWRALLGRRPSTDR